MIVCYELKMPNPPSWNGRWSGEDRLWAICRTYKQKFYFEHIAKLLGSHSYRWEDGWCAVVEVRLVDPQKAKAIRKNSAGFNGYDWMINSLEKYGKILADHQIPDIVQ